MRSFVLIGLIGALFASTSIARAHNTRSSWSVAKAETLVAYDATVPPLSAAERASLLPELNRTVRLFGALRLAVQFVAAANRGDYDTVCRLYSARYLRASQASCRWLYGWGAQLYGPYDYRIVRQRMLPNGHRRIDLIRWQEPSFIELALERAGWRIVAGGW